MIKLDRANYLLSDIELLNDIALQLYDNDPNDRVNNTAIIAEFVAPAIQWEIPMALEYLNRKISSYNK